MLRLGKRKRVKRQGSLTSFFTEPSGDKQKVCSNNEVSRFEKCPICFLSFPRHSIQNHANTCVGEKEDIPTKDDFGRQKECSKKNINHDKRNFGNDCNSNNVPSISSPASFFVKEKNDSQELGDQFTRIDNVGNDHDGHLPTKNMSQNDLSAQKQWNDLFCKAKNDTHRNFLTPTEEPIPGLFVYENFITEEEENSIISELDNISNDKTLQYKRDDNKNHDCMPWKYSNFNGTHFGKRWGVHCNLRDRRVDMPECPLPLFIQEILLPKLAKLYPMKGCVPNEANAIDYRKNSGHYLRHHVDDRKLSKEPIANLSLAGSCFMTYIHERKKTKINSSAQSTDLMHCPNQQQQYSSKNSLQSFPAHKKVLLNRRALQVLTGKARYEYSHGIENTDLLSTRRISITMRESPLTYHKL